MSSALRNNRAQAAPADDSRRYRLILRAWEAINIERDLQSVLAAIAEVLTPVVPFTGVAVIAPEVVRGQPYALHTVGGLADACESEPELSERAQIRPVEPHPVRPLRPYDGSEMARLRDMGEAYVCADLFELSAWYPHQFKLAAAGIRAYTSVPLQVRGRIFGVVVFSRTWPEAFTPEQMSVLIDVARPIAVAVANALAWQEIHSLRDQLQQENVTLRNQLAAGARFDGIVGDAPTLQRALELVEQVAATDATVLVTGETGTGKELIARAIHRLSPRVGGPLIRVNCAAIPETLLASELFGHERGAFTGAVERRRGRFEQAHGGTLFLDEIGELPPEMQVMLLRVLQEREFERLGGNATIRADVRVVAATNRDLTEATRAGRFRSDLYYRLNVFPVRVPPLRERVDDIPMLAAHFAEKHGARFGRKVTRIDRRTLRLLESYHWPGNIRELENVIERAVILSRNGTLRIERDELPEAEFDAGVDSQLQAQERELIEAALRASQGRIAGANGAAKRLGLAPSTLEFRIRKLGIDKYQYRARNGKNG